MTTAATTTGVVVTRTWRVSGELEKPEDANDWEELEDVGVLEVRGQLLQDQVNVEAQGGNVVDDVHTEKKKNNQ